jgi:flagellar motility protein MotE (MotC chaperone)
LQSLGFVNSRVINNKIVENGGIMAVREAVNKNIANELFDNKYKLPKDLKFQKDQIAFFNKSLYKFEALEADVKKVDKYKEDIGDLKIKIDTIDYVVDKYESKLGGIQETSAIIGCDPAIVECKRL